MDILVIADDYGYDEDNDNTILNAFVNGSISRASLLLNVNPSNVSLAVQKALVVGMPLCLHISLTEGYKSKRTKINENEEKIEMTEIRLPTKEEFWNQIETFDVEEAIQEIQRQIDLFFSYVGEFPFWMNSHNHVHVVPRLVTPLAKLLSNQKLKNETQKIILRR